MRNQSGCSAELRDFLVSNWATVRGPTRGESENDRVLNGMEKTTGVGWRFCLLLIFTSWEFQNIRLASCIWKLGGCTCMSGSYCSAPK